MKISLRTARALLAALLLLAGFSRWLDRPAIVPGDVLALGSVFQLTSAQTLLPADGLFTYVWSARSEEPAVAYVTLDRLPRGRPLAIALAGHADKPVRLTWTGGSQEVRLRNGDWQEIPLAVSSGKNCCPLRIEAALSGPGEFVSLSRPFYLDFLHGDSARLLGRAATLGLTFLWITILAAAAAAGLRRQWPDLPLFLLPILGASFVALCGYGIFWCYFAYPRAGDLAAIALGLVALWHWIRDDQIPALWREPEWTRSWLALFAVGLAYFALLHFWATDSPWSWIGGNRYVASLAGDNQLPWVYGQRVLEGQSSRILDAADPNWLSSDRPPLQMGWLALLGPWLHAGGGPLDSTTQTMGFWFQLLWVPALTAFFRRLGLGLRDALLLVFLSALSGVLVVNSLYVWPKLSAAAFCLAGWVLLRGRLDAGTSVRDTVLGGLCLVLGFLSHGAAAFALLAIAPLWLWPRRRFPWKNLVLCALVAGATYAPWWAYQHFYQPPANRLIKWHLAGVVPIDPRGSWETIRQAYHEKSWTELWAIRRANLDFAIVQGDWPYLGKFFSTDTVAARLADFFHLLRSIGWWNAGLLFLPFSLWLANRRRPALTGPDTLDFATRSLLWTILSYVVWWLLEFGPWPYIHTMSYNTPLLLIGLALWSLLLLHRVALLATSLLAGLYFCTYYGLSAPSAFSSHPAWAALLPLLLALGLAGILLAPSRARTSA